MTGKPRVGPRLVEQATVDARALRVHPAKRAPSRAESVPLSPPPPAAPVPMAPGARRRVRPLVASTDLGRRLEAAGISLEPERLAAVLEEIETALAGRSLRALDAAGRAGIATRARAALVAAAPGVRRLQRELAEAARGLGGAVVGRGLRIATVEMRDGVWLFVHTDVAKDAVVVGEAFVAARPGVAVPRRPEAKRAGLAGVPRWRDGDVIRAAPPTLAPSTPQASGLAEGAFEDGTDALLAEYARAEDVAEAASAPRSPRPVRTAGPLGARERLTEGGGIESIEVRAPAVGGPPPGERAWDLWYTISGRTAPEIARRAEREMDALLPPSGELGDPRYAGWARAHGWGPVLGDETFAALSYAPHEAVNLLQLATTEGFARWGAGASGINVRTGSALRIDVKVQHRVVGGRPRPFLRSAEYTVALEDGKQIVATLEVDHLGRVTTSVR